jgi:hypothetical protein
MYVRVSSCDLSLKGMPTWLSVISSKTPIVPISRQFFHLITFSRIFCLYLNFLTPYIWWMIELDFYLTFSFYSCSWCWQCLLVKGWKGSSWSFPRGKKSKDEEDDACAIREVSFFLMMFTDCFVYLIHLSWCSNWTLDTNFIDSNHWSRDNKLQCNF